MDERIKKEIALLKKYYKDLELDENGKWVIIRNYSLPKNMKWNKEVIDLCFVIPIGYPGANPYGIYVPLELKYGEQQPNNINPNIKEKPPFPGNWVLLSWTPVEKWNYKSEITKGSNLLNFVQSFCYRFKDGR